jgi:hypothetical protein
MKYQVKDNFLDEKTLSSIKETIFSTNFPWYVVESITGKDEGCYLVHLLFKDSQLYSPEIFNVISPIVQKLDIFALRRIKANYYPVTSNIIEHSYHIDYKTPHAAAIFYLNSNDGFTVLDDGTRIESVENRLLLFEGHKEHKSTTCTNNPIGRFNINFNYINT